MRNPHYYYIEYRINSLKVSPYSVLHSYTAPVYHRLYKTKLDMEGRQTKLKAEGWVEEIERGKLKKDKYNYYNQSGDMICLVPVTLE